MSSNSKEVKSLLRTSRLIAGGIFIQASLFALWGVSFFLAPSDVKPNALWPTILFSLMGLATFAYGVRFFKNFSAVKRKELLAQEPKKRKESLLLIVAIQYLTLEFVCVLGILLSIFLQNTNLVYPFYAFFVVGMALSMPKEVWFSDFYQAGE